MRLFDSLKRVAEPNYRYWRVVISVDEGELGWEAIRYIRKDMNEWLPGIIHYICERMAEDGVWIDGSYYPSHRVWKVTPYEIDKEEYDKR